MWKKINYVMLCYVMQAILTREEPNLQPMLKPFVSWRGPF